jgi:hypothetical protein
MKPIFFCLIFFYTVSAFCNFDRLNNFEVPVTSLPSKEDTANSYDWPNENEPGVIIDYLNRDNMSDLMISVGTLRTLVIFGWSSNMSHLLMADNNSNISEINKKHLSLIQCIATSYQTPIWQRLQYIAHMSGVALKNEPTDEDMPCCPLEYVYKKIHAQDKITALPDDTNCLNFMPFKKSSFTAQRMPISLDPSTSSYRFFDYIKVNDEHFYWEDNTQWEKITHAIANGNVAVTNLNLVAKEDLQSINNFVEESGLKLGLIDISNVADHVQMNDDPKGTTLKLWSSRIKNLKAENILLTNLAGNIFEKLYCTFGLQLNKNGFWKYYLTAPEQFSDMLLKIATKKVTESRY